MATFPFWSRQVNEIAQGMNSSLSGLSEKDAQEALRRVGRNRIQSRERVHSRQMFCGMENPLRSQRMKLFPVIWYYSPLEAWSLPTGL